MISVPDPTTVLMVPAAIPASRMATTSRGSRSRRAPLRRGHPGRPGRSRRFAGGCGRCWRGRRRPLAAGATPRRPRSPSAPLRGRWSNDESGSVSGSIASVSTRLRGPSTLCGMPATSCTAEPRPSSALVISRGHHPDLVGRALGDLRHHLEVLVGQQRLVGLPVVDGLEDRLDGLSLTLGLEDRGLAVGLGAQDQRLAVTLGREDRRLLVALRGEDRRTGAGPRR